MMPGQMLFVPAYFHLEYKFEKLKTAEKNKASQIPQKNLLHLILLFHNVDFNKISGELGCRKAIFSIYLFQYISCSFIFMTCIDFTR